MDRWCFATRRSLATHVVADGLDQRYWDLEVEGQVITLHLEHCLGIMLLVEDAGPDWVASKRFQVVVRRLQTE
ncbi:hypothetical protein [Pseudomonas sp. HLT2-19-2]